MFTLTFGILVPLKCIVITITIIHVTIKDIFKAFILPFELAMTYLVSFGFAS